MKDKKWYGYVYAIYNSWNDRIYIGSSIFPLQRWGQHRHAAKCETDKNDLHRDMREQRLQGFHFERIDCANDEKALRRLERRWIKELDTTNPIGGYNAFITYGEKLTNKTIVRKIEKILKMQLKRKIR